MREQIDSAMNEPEVLRVITLEGTAPGAALASLCAGETSVAIVARCDSIPALRKALMCKQADLLLLDTEACQQARTASREDVVGLMRTLRLQTLPLTIVVTPSMGFARAAFEIGAVDYLVKPIAEQRFHGAIKRARERMSQVQALRLYRRYAHAAWPAAVQTLPPARTRLQQLTIKSGGRVRFLATDDIHCIVSCRNNVIVYAGNASHVFRSTLGAIEKQLADRSFLRIERSIVVNLRYVREVQRLPRKRFRFRLQNGQSHVSGAFHYRSILRYLRECQPFLGGARTRSAANEATRIIGAKPYVTPLSHGTPTTRAPVAEAKRR